eukprot:TRINITY_DN8224_c0_g1_i2.p1 TRINITY_DN8224_c0_g1~~TRINITY_DN8224_c0_g1_i2.p1  ORF type:complete len:597 (+),score=187.00 TRINITY_DN8224_c0_g1_i2:175-1965(+)
MNAVSAAVMRLLGRQHDEESATSTTSPTLKSDSPSSCESTVPHAPESLDQAVARLSRATIPVVVPPADGQPHEAKLVGVVPQLPSDHGDLHVRAYYDPAVGDILAIVFGDTRGKTAVPVRVHDQCQTSEVFGSRKCDCAQQLRNTVQMFQRDGLGVLLYMPQEGRGIGLANKMAAYELQETFGCDTVDANTLIGLPEEGRDYRGVPSILAEMGIDTVKLVTNNPYKVKELSRLGVRIVGRERAVFEAPHAESRKYLETKAARMGHAIPEDSCCLHARAADAADGASPSAARAWPVDGEETKEAAVERLLRCTVPLTPPDNDTPKVATLVGEVPAMPTHFGPLHVLAFHQKDVGDIFVVKFGDVRGAHGVPVRVHDQCQTSEVFGSHKCDCAQQLEHTITKFRDDGFGVFIYMPQEGRGIGLANKMAAYELQERFGCDTLDANTLIGLPDEARNYSGVPAILDTLGVASVSLVTNNPYKHSELRRLGVSVVARERAVFVEPHAASVKYLRVKESRMGHAISEDSVFACKSDERAAEDDTAKRLAEYVPSKEARAVAAYSARQQMAHVAIRGDRDHSPTLVVPQLDSGASAGGSFLKF